ncbi:hypothetical protein B0T25DRAFT_365522 [Lasiosphaeria hispida]|uniref:Uncharacterized protein n=1 Tax=Lasiosphaeria hispida TaxID=260671 RepID=A0AAJ0H5L5_9PEZI|nr:hypothetical protein B0T25DRAFT_365522 [Lasiosphaeria hispida]
MAHQHALLPRCLAAAHRPPANTRLDLTNFACSHATGTNSHDSTRHGTQHSAHGTRHTAHDTRAQTGCQHGQARSPSRQAPKRTIQREASPSAAGLVALQVCCPSSAPLSHLRIRCAASGPQRSKVPSCMCVPGPSHQGRGSKAARPWPLSPYPRERIVRMQAPQSADCELQAAGRCTIPCWLGIEMPLFVPPWLRSSPMPDRLQVLQTST